MSKIIQEMRDNQLSQTALNFANTSKINRLEPTILYSLHNAVKKFLTPCKGCSAYLPNDGELYVPLELAATLADFTHDVAMAVARRASTIHSNNYMAHSQIKKVVGVRRLYKD